MGTKNNPGKFDAYEKAEPDEPMFTLLGRDSSAPATIRHWVRYRLQSGDKEIDKLKEALQCADDMASYWLKKSK